MRCDGGGTHANRFIMKKINQLTINFLGDSITEGAWATEPQYTYVARVAAKLGCKTNNCGISGTRIAPKHVPSECAAFDRDFLQRAREMPDADLVFVFGGTNDYGHGDADFGTLNDQTPQTFCGAVRQLANYLTERYGKNNVCFILPLRRYNDDNPLGEGARAKPTEPLSSYIRAEREIVGQMGVACLDMSDVFPAPQVNTPTELFQDGLHPTNKGHELIAEIICKYVRSIVK